MKKVLLLGDEIRVAYQVRVKELLADVCEVVAPHYNSGYSASTLWFIREQHDHAYDWSDLAVIHWNTGIWDLHRPFNDGLPLIAAEDYLRWHTRLCTQLSAYTGKLIFATTTPAGEGYKYDPNTIYGVPREQWNHDVESYNGVVSAYLRTQGVVINDLHALVSEHPEYLGEDGINLSEAGVEAVAQKVASEIRALLDDPTAETEPAAEQKTGNDKSNTIRW